ncbi:MAG: lipopolysaccharide biosynthesis protein [Chloroflexaceae bacterium]|nr:lipopolysaccharide biosynthesis protein [Chloroflexaceae bacterium]
MKRASFWAKSGKNRDPLATDVVQSDLKVRSVRSGLITFAAQPVKFALGVGSTAILARLLQPEDFGLVAMVTPLLVLVDSISNLGLETAIVHKAQLNPQQASAIFWLSLKINAFVIGGMVLMAPVLAWFYGRGELVGIVLMMAVGAFALCAAFQHKSLLQRQLRFGILTTIEVVSTVLGAFVGVFAAWRGFGYWSLVLQLVVMQVSNSTAYWFACDWRPARAIASQPQADLGQMISYGAHLTGFRFLTRFGKQLDRVLIGYFSGAAALGLYSVAYNWAYFPFDQIYNPMFNVAVASLSRAHEDPQSYRLYCRRGLLLLFSLCMPALAFLFVEARPVILVLLGEKWLEAIPLFRLLLIAVFVGSLFRVTKWLYVSAGQTQRQFRWALIHTPVSIVAIAIGAGWGSFGVALGYTVAICLLTVPSVVYCLKFSAFGVEDFFKTAVRPIFASTGAAAILFFGSAFLPPINPPIAALIVKGTGFGICYLLLWLVPLGDGQDPILSLKTLITSYRQFRK